MAALYTNENFPVPAVEALRALGHDVLTVLEAGNANQRIPDADVLAYGRQNNRAVVTHNRLDFIRLHKRGAEHAGIITCYEDPDFQRLASRIHIEITTRGALAGQLIRVPR